MVAAGTHGYRALADLSTRQSASEEDFDFESLRGRTDEVCIRAFPSASTTRAAWR